MGRAERTGTVAGADEEVGVGQALVVVLVSLDYDVRLDWEGFFVFLLRVALDPEGEVVVEGSVGSGEGMDDGVETGFRLGMILEVDGLLLEGLLGVDEIVWEVVLMGTGLRIAADVKVMSGEVGQDGLDEGGSGDEEEIPG
jgi:hypothetical protein